MKIALVLTILFVPGLTAAQNQASWKPNRYEVVCDRSKDCLSGGLKHRVDMFLRKIVRHYQGHGWRAPKDFGPIIGKGKDAAVKVHDMANDNIAYVTPPCGRPRTTMHVGRGAREFGSKLHIFYYFFAHEMFHAIQGAYPAFSKRPCGTAGWVKESTADAVALDATRRAFPKAVHATSEREARKYAGLRRYDVPLNPYFKKFDGKEYFLSLIHI